MDSQLNTSAADKKLWLVKVMCCEIIDPAPAAANHRVIAGAHKRGQGMEGIMRQVHVAIDRRGRG